MYELVLYQSQYRKSLLEFMTVCLPESGRTFELFGRHSMYQDVTSFYQEFYCLLDGKKVIGTVAIKKMDEEKCELKALFLLKKYQGEKLGYKMAKHGIQRAKELGYQEIFLDTIKTSTNAISLYKKLGFKETNRYNNNRMADIFMCLKISEFEG